MYDYQSAQIVADAGKAFQAAVATKDRVIIGKMIDANIALFKMYDVEHPASFDRYISTFRREELAYARAYFDQVRDDASEFWMKKDWLGGAEFLCLHGMSDMLPAGAFRAVHSFLYEIKDAMAYYKKRIALTCKAFKYLDPTVSFRETELAIEAYVSVGSMKASLLDLNHDSTFHINKLYMEEVEAMSDLENKYLVLSDGRFIGKILPGDRKDTMYTYGMDVMYDGDFDYEDLAVVKEKFVRGYSGFTHSGISTPEKLELKYEKSSYVHKYLIDIDDTNPVKQFKQSHIEAIMEHTHADEYKVRYQLWRGLVEIWNKRLRMDEEIQKEFFGPDAVHVDEMMNDILEVLITDEKKDVKESIINEIAAAYDEPDTGDMYERCSVVGLSQWSRDMVNGSYSQLDNITSVKWLEDHQDDLVSIEEVDVENMHEGSSAY